MKDFQFVIQNFLKNHEKHKKYIALLTVLSLVVSFAVPFSLIMPAVSMTKDSSSFQNMYDDNLTLLGAGIQNGAINLSCNNNNENEYFHVVVKAGENEIYNSYDGTPSKDYTVSGNSVKLDFSLTYKKKNVTLPSTAPHLYVDLTQLGLSDTTFVLDENSRSGAIFDSEYSTSAEAGTYEITDDGYIKITLTDDYIKHVNSGDKSLAGSLEFSGTMKRADNEDGDRKFDIGGQEVTVKFEDKMPSVNKSSSVNKTDGTIQWTIVVSNPAKIDLSSYTLTDQMFQYAKNLTIDPDSAGSFSNSEVKFTSDSKGVEYITITYSTDITPEQLKNEKASNTAQLTKDDKIITSKPSEVFLGNAFNVDKKGTPDYQTGAYENKINWEINISSNYGTSLNGYKITDNQIPDGKYTIEPDTVTISKSGNYWVINARDNQKSVKIKYSTDTDSSNTQYNNKVKFDYPDPDPNKPAGEKDITVEYKNSDDLISVDKSGNYDKDKHEITWTINIKPEQGCSLSGYEISDTQFPDWDKISFSPDYAKNSAVYDSANHKITFNGTYSGNVTLQYTTKIDIPENVQTTIVSNDFGDNRKPSTSTVTVKVDVRNSLEKSLNQNKTETVASNGSITKNLSWKADIVLDGSFKDLVYNDTLSVVGNGASHTITDDQLNSIQIIARTSQYGGPTTLVKDTDYTITRTGSGFSIKFNESLDNSGFNYLSIAYNTTVTADKTDENASYPVDYEFKNNAEFNGNSKGDSFTLTRTNPNVDEKMNLGVNKKWNNDDANSRPQNITVKVMYKTNLDGTWRYVKGTENNFIMYGQNGYDSASDYTLTLSSSDNWDKTINGLPKKFSKAKNDGTQDTVTEYYYKVVETAVDGKTISNGMFEYGNGAYTVSYNNENGVNGDNILYINNTYYSDITLTPQKIWSGDSNSGEEINNITAVLMYSVDNYNYYPVKKNGNNYVFDKNTDIADACTVTLSGSGNTWTGANFENLPSRIFADGSIKECRYKLREIKYNDTEISNENRFETSAGYYTIYAESANSSGNISVKNIFTKNIDITPEKTWVDKNYKSHTPNDVAEITVRLEYSNSNDNNYYPVKIKDNQYIFDNGGNTEGAVFAEKVLTSGSNWTSDAWSNLPKKYIGSDGNEKTRTYRIVEVSYKLAGSNDSHTLINNKFSTPDGYYESPQSSGSTNDTSKLSLQNKFYPNEKLTIKASKTWHDVSDSSNMPESITVELQRKPSNTGIWEKVENSEKKLNSQNSWKCDWNELINQETLSDGTVVTYTYRVAETGFNDFKLTDGTNVFAVNENGYYQISYNNNELSQSGTVTVTNTWIANELEITPQKKWDDSGFESQRPQNVTLKLQRKLGVNGTYEDVKGSVDENGKFTANENGSAVTVTLSGSNALSGDTATWQGIKITGLPKEKITVDSGNFTHETYYYRLVESKYDNTNIADNSTSFSTANGKYTITNYENITSNGTYPVLNKFEESIGITKTILNSKTGNALTSIEKDELQKPLEVKDSNGKFIKQNPYKKRISGKEYYVFNWVIEYDGNNISLIRPVSDKLPEGFTLCTDDATWAGKQIYWAVNIPSDILTPIMGSDTIKPATRFFDGYYEHPVMLWENQGANCANKANSESDIWSKWEQGDWYYYDTASNTVYFNKPRISQTMYVCYSTKIECDVLDAKIQDGTYVVTNHATKHERDGTPTDKTATASLKIVNPSDKDLITKTYSESKVPGYINYSIKVNPEGKNLSNGDTIDIEDIFKTNSYYDSCKKQLYKGDDLIDVLMNNIKIYEVDADGNKTELASNQYKLQFTNGKDVSEGVSILKLTIPDEKHIVIDYTYKIIANEKTPSVINKCKSSTKVNGRYITMEAGLVPPAGDKITLSNTANLISDSASASSSQNEKQYEISKSSGTISTNRLPAIKKVNTGDYTINDLEATFLFAKYENGQWYYATSVDDKTRVITWSVTGCDGNSVDENALEISVKQAYEVSLSHNVLYKLVEVSVPDGYEGSNLRLTFNGNNNQFKEMLIAYLNNGSTLYNGNDYKNFLENYVSTHYFSYNSILSSYPQGISGNDVMQIKAGDSIEIPNNELIDIGIKKNWITSDSVSDSEITVELYWSYEKSANGIPSSAVLADDKDLGIIDSEFTSSKTVNASDNNTQLWKDLPNGKNSKPIYYYVKETAYKINGKTYTLDSESGTYKNGSETGKYYPTYIGNASNSDSAIEIRNSAQLMLKKEWKKSNNDIMLNPPVDTINVSIYGLLPDGSQALIFKDIELNKLNNWQADITSLITPEMNISQYSGFVAVESGISEEISSNFVVSCVFNLNSSTGEIVVTNKNTAPSDASVKVNKVWGDGNELHSGDSIQVALYQKAGTPIDLSNSSWQTILSGMKPIKTAVLTAENEWTYTWTGLPLENDSQELYYYYVLEQLAPAQDKYTPSYAVVSKSASKTEYTVTNSRNAIVAKKQWTGEDGNIISSDSSDIPVDEITLDVYKKTVNIPSKNLKVIAFGDSITDGYDNCSRNGKDYPSKLIKLLTDNGYTISNSSNVYDFNKGSSGQQIGGSDNEGFRSRVSSDIPADTNIVFFLGGTNDIHQGGSAVKGNPQGVYERFVACIEKIKKQAPDAVIFVGSIPHFDFYKDGKLTEGGSWWNWLSGYSDNDGAVPNGFIDQYNALIKNYTESTNGVYFVDTCSVVTDDKIRNDGCHPNEEGYTAIANEYYNAVTQYYNSSSKVGEITLSKSNNWISAFDIENPDANSTYYVDEKNVPAGWQVSYADNEQTLGSGTAITVTNTRHTPKTSLSVKKIWENDSADTSARDNISLTLLRSTDRINWEELEVPMPVPVKSENIWIYKYGVDENNNLTLPAEDNAGNQYFYKIEEEILNGYTVSYVNPDGIISADDADAGQITVKNTRAVSLTVKKIWSDIDTNQHLNDVVKIKIYRSSDKNDVPEDSNLILKVPSSASVGVGKDITLVANKTVKSAISDNGNVTVTVDGQNINIHGVSDGTSVITVSDGTETRTINVTVSSLEIFLNNSSDFRIEAGEKGTLSAKKSGSEVSNVTFTSDNDSIISVSGSQITANNIGKALITAECDGISATQEIEVILPSAFSIVGESEVAIGNSITLGIDKNYGTFEWSSSDNSKATVNNGVVTGVEAGTVTITATRNDGKTAKIDINVLNKAISLKAGDNVTIPFENGITSKDIDNIVINIENIEITNQYYYNLEIKMLSDLSNIWNNSEQLAYYENNNNKLTQSSYKLNLSGWNLTNGLGLYIASTNVNCTIKSITINTKNTASFSANGLNSVNMMKASQGSGTLVQEITISGSDTDWTKTVSNLDVYDSDGKPYYYWAVEETVSGYDISYLFDDDDDMTDYCINSSLFGKGEITVKNTKQESQGIEMPSTGGKGSEPYELIGLVIAGGALTILCVRRRRKNY